jgi:molybdopterin biosynthesis enzyme MoaB
VLDLETGAAVRRVLSGVPGVVVVQESYAASNRNWVEETLRRWCDEEELDLVLTIGGTLPAPGPSSREIVPEATLAVLERGLPGLGEAMRGAVRRETPLALLERGVAGIRGRTLIVNLPAGGGAATRFLAAVRDLVPGILAHLRDDPSAPTLQDELPVEPGDTAEDEETGVEESRTTDAPSGRGKRLDAGEFAAFLRRRKSEEE